MLDKTLKERVDKILADSQVKAQIITELSALCAEKPDEMSIDEFGREVSGIIMHQLHDQLLEVCQNNGQTAIQQPAVKTEVPLDFESIIPGLLSGMEHELLIGNLQMVAALGSAVAQRDTGTSEHNFRVTLYTYRLGREMSCSRRQLQSLLKGSFLHDVGKIGIRDQVLLKRGKLSGEEKNMMRDHVLMGLRIIRGVSWLDDARDIIRHHHEKYDGSGYPGGLAGENIPVGARIFAIADVFDALTTERPYKPAVSYEESMGIMAAQSGIHFCPVMFSVFSSVSRQLYDEMTKASLSDLRRAVNQIVTELFGVSPLTDQTVNGELARSLFTGQPGISPDRPS
ncbi:MAG: HD domain-containing phosphohydrolase [candidate division Zixibacteria bacterium]